GELHVELLREPAEIRNGADRHDVVEVDAELHGTGRSIQRPTRMTALKTQCAAILVASVPVARRNPAMMTPPTKTTTSAPTAAAIKETAANAAPATTNCPLPPVRIAVLPMSRWRRLLHRTSRMPKSQILIAGRRQGDGSRLAGDQKRGLDVVAGKVNLPV